MAARRRHAASVASFLTLIAAGPIAWLYSSNTSNVPQIRPDAEPALFTGDELESVEETAA